MWGYPFLMYLIGTAGLFVLQMALAIFSFSFAYVLFIERVTNSWSARVIVLVMSVPWFAYMSVKWPAAIAVPLAWIAIGLLALAIRRHLDVRLLCVAGALIGLAANFRSEMLILGIFLIVTVPIWHLGSTRSIRGLMKAQYWGLLTFPVLLIALLIPWAGFQYIKTGHFLLTSSNSGAVSVITLGQLPGNPWGIDHNDSEQSRIMHSLGFDSLDPLSATGNAILQDYFLDAIADHPLAFGKKVVSNTKNALMGGLYIGDWELPLDSEDKIYIEITKEKIKLALGLNPNTQEIQGYVLDGTWDLPFRISFDQVLFGVVLASLMFSNAMLLVSIAGGLLSAVKRQAEVEIKIVVIVLLFVLAMAALLQYQPRHINVALPAILALALPLIPRSIRVPKFSKGKVPAKLKENPLS